MKIDLHLHTREGEKFISYDARGLIDRAAREGFRVLSITNHDTLTFSEHLAAYARERGDPPHPLHAIQRGDAFLSRLEGEWCLRFF